MVFVLKFGGGDGTVTDQISGCVPGVCEFPDFCQVSTSSVPIALKDQISSLVSK